MIGHSRDTIKKAIQGKPWSNIERAHQPFPVPGPYLTIIDDWLKADKDQSKKQHHTVRRV